MIIIIYEYIIIEMYRAMIHHNVWIFIISNASLSIQIVLHDDKQYQNVIDEND